MSSIVKKLQVFFLAFAGAGLFAPVLVAKTSSASISFISTTDGKVLLGIIVLAVVCVATPNNKNPLVTKIISLVLTGLAAILFFYNISRAASAIRYLSAIKYGIGYYITLVGIIVSLILGVLALIFKDNDNANTNNFNRPMNYNNQPRPNFDPNTGEPINRMNNELRPNFDPNTGEPINRMNDEPRPNFDPNTGEPINRMNDEPKPNFDPNTGEPINRMNNEPMPNFDPNTGEPINKMRLNDVVNHDNNNPNNNNF